MRCRAREWRAALSEEGATRRYLYGRECGEALRFQVQASQNANTHPGRHERVEVSLHERYGVVARLSFPENLFVPGASFAHVT